MSEVNAVASTGREERETKTRKDKKLSEATLGDLPFAE
jgi:hypothetical protein